MSPPAIILITKIFVILTKNKFLIFFRRNKELKISENKPKRIPPQREYQVHLAKHPKTSILQYLKNASHNS